MSAAVERAAWTIWPRVGGADLQAGRLARTRDALDAAFDVDAVALDIARTMHPIFWDPEHRAVLLSINPDQAMVDGILEERRAWAIEAQRSAVRLVRAAILGSDQ